MRAVPVPEHRETPFIVIFTDLDGTLLDHASYLWEEAVPALERCKNLRVPVILVSSKTRAEMEVLGKALGLSYPFISENGGGLFFPLKGGEKAPLGATRVENMWRLSLGTPYPQLVASFRAIREELGWKLRGFSDMTPQEIARVTGLDLEGAHLSSRREYDEPFLVEEAGGLDTGPLLDAARRRGLQISLGGRFFHLHGKNDKGTAVQRLTAWYREIHGPVFTAALGDSPNDFSMLKHVDHPVLIRSSKRYPELEAALPGMRISRDRGPRGWNVEVLGLLKEPPNKGAARDV